LDDYCGLCIRKYHFAQSAHVIDICRYFTRVKIIAIHNFCIRIFFNTAHNIIVANDSFERNQIGAGQQNPFAYFLETIFFRPFVIKNLYSP
jgi:hypothetical protein